MLVFLDTRARTHALTHSANVATATACTDMRSPRDFSPWSAEAWTASDDRVRGGKSQSYLDCPEGGGKAVFHGTLDITALGGAGFASQRTVDRAQQPQWDVSAYDGLRLKLLRQGNDGKKYTLTLKDEVLPRMPDGREQSTVSWEYDFVSPKEGDEDQVLYVPWDDFKPTYRGKPKPDAPILDLANVRRISLMMRRYVASTIPSYFWARSSPILPRQLYHMEKQDGSLFCILAFSDSRRVPSGWRSYT